MTTIVDIRRLKVNKVNEVVCITNMTELLLILDVKLEIS